MKSAVVLVSGGLDSATVLALAIEDGWRCHALTVDYSGYPDCRPEFMAAFEKLANLATRRAVEGAPISIETPIIGMGKDEIVRRGVALGVDFSLTVSCYSADTAGRACGHCDACRFRRAGFEKSGVADPTRYQG